MDNTIYFWGWIGNFFDSFVDWLFESQMLGYSFGELIVGVGLVSWLLRRLTLVAQDHPRERPGKTDKSE